MWQQAYENCGKMEMRMAQFPEEILPCIQWLTEHRPLHRILEIGTDYGGTAALWCELADEQVVSVDLAGGPYSSMELTTQYAIDRNKKLKTQYPHFIGLIADSHKQETVETVRQVLTDKIELLFIDADHSFEGVTKDYEMYREFVRPGGVILFHDINESPLIKSLNVGVYRFWRSLSGFKREFTINSAWGGLGALVV